MTGQILLGILIGIIIVLSLLVTLFEKFERLVSYFWRMFAWFNKSSAKRYVKHNTKALIEERAKSLMIPYRVRIEFVDEKNIEARLDEKKGDVILYLHNYKNQSRNLVVATNLYVAKALIPYARKYVQPEIMESADCIISKEILKKDVDATNMYIEEIIEPRLGDNKFQDWLNKIEIIHNCGHLTTILLREYNQQLSSLYPAIATANHFGETAEFAQLLYDLDTKEKDVDINPSYRGNYISCVIIPVGRSKKMRSRDPTKPFMSAIQIALQEGHERVYLVARGSNVQWVDLIAKDACNQYGLSISLQETYKRRFKGQERSIIVLCLEKLVKSGSA